MTDRFVHEMPFGASLRDDGSVRFRLWAPSQERVSVALEGADGRRDLLPMSAEEDGWFEIVTDRATTGTRYRYVLADGLQVPDPASRYQDRDIDGPSVVVNPRAYQWKTPDWRGRPWEEAVLYELHVGAFGNPDGFDGVRRRLDYLADLGVTAVELMPIADFPGQRNWGYDGVLPYAPDASYGRPDELKRLIDEAHERNLMVFLDVVYNHFGPEGNYLHAYAERFFTERHHTPWGAAINFDGPDSRPVRDFFIHNTLYWLNEYRFDGLRFDAVHAIIDDGTPHILTELAETALKATGADRPTGGRHVHLVLENGDNAARYLERERTGRPTQFVAQWNDDYHNVCHRILTGETDSYYADFAERPIPKLARALTEGFVFQGESLIFHDGTPRGEPSAHLPPAAFVNFLQNHDQVGNRAFGERLSVLAQPRALRAATTMLLLAPHPPMLFMGEEWGSDQPFNFFCDFHDELADAVREGRRREFSGFPQFADPVARERIPDPNAEETYRRSCLDWRALERPDHADWLAFYKRLLRLRRREIVPRLRGVAGRAGTAEVIAGRGLVVSWRLAEGDRLTLVANVSGQELAGFAPPPGELLFETERGLSAALSDGRLPDWSALWFLASRFGV